MLSFIQYITEDFTSHVGFLHPNGNHIRVNWKHGEPMPSHHEIAAKHGYKDAQDAIKHGLIRYFHYQPLNSKSKSAGYEFVNKPHTRQLVSNHLGSSGGFNSIMLDKHNPKNFNDIDRNTREFHDTQSACNHLDSIKEDINEDIKGWMSPSGKAHIFNPDNHHAFNIHPEIKSKVHKTVAKLVGKQNATQRPNSDWDKHEGIGMIALNHAMTHGHARFGTIGGQHFVHFDRKAPGGKTAAAAALRYLKPHHHDDEIAITSKPVKATLSKDKTRVRVAWPADKDDKIYNKRSQAAAHIQQGK